MSIDETPDSITRPGSVVDIPGPGRGVLLQYDPSRGTGVMDDPYLCLVLGNQGHSAGRIEWMIGVTPGRFAVGDRVQFNRPEYSTHLLGKPGVIEHDDEDGLPFNVRFDDGDLATAYARPEHLVHETYVKWAAEQAVAPEPATAEAPEPTASRHPRKAGDEVLFTSLWPHDTAVTATIRRVDEFDSSLPYLLDTIGGGIVWARESEVSNRPQPAPAPVDLGYEARIVNLERRLTRERDEHEREMAAFKRRVARVAMREATEHNWCGVVRRALDEMGIEVPQPSATVEVLVKYTITLRAASDDGAEHLRYEDATRIHESLSLSGDGALTADSDFEIVEIHDTAVFGVESIQLDSEDDD